MLLRRLGGHDRLWGWLHNNRGAMRTKQGRLAEGLEDQRRAVVAKEEAAGPESADVALSLANIAVVLQHMGDAAEAARYAERGLALLEAGVGPQHPRTAIVRSNWAEILNELGRFAEAKTMAQSAIDAIEGEVDPGGLFIAFPLMALARGHLGANEPGEALPILERVAGICKGSTGAAALSGEVHFALARAIHGTGGALERARALATRARADYVGSPLVPATVRAIAEIDAWLAASATP